MRIPRRIEIRIMIVTYARRKILRSIVTYLAPIWLTVTQLQLLVGRWAIPHAGTRGAGGAFLYGWQVLVDRFKNAATVNSLIHEVEQAPRDRSGGTENASRSSTPPTHPRAGARNESDTQNARIAAVLQPQRSGAQERAAKRTMMGGQCAPLSIRSN
ncbi:hypothetical protein T492DRAFT_836540 [Pavlovales sp. CCMP2436]|nr:hypothetical protein T492DRAFT_836540 [Pavlovales sp. CCMP2436]